MSARKSAGPYKLLPPIESRSVRLTPAQNEIFTLSPENIERTDVSIFEPFLLNKELFGSLTKDRQKAIVSALKSAEEEKLNELLEYHEELSNIQEIKSLPKIPTGKVQEAYERSPAKYALKSQRPKTPVPFSRLEPITKTNVSERELSQRFKKLQIPVGVTEKEFNNPHYLSLRLAQLKSPAKTTKKGGKRRVGLRKTHKRIKLNKTLRTKRRFNKRRKTRKY